MTTINVTNKLGSQIQIGATLIPGSTSAVVTGVALNQLMTLRAAGIIDFTTDGPIDSYGGPFNRTYSASILVSPALLATDLVTITGSANSVINVTRIYVSGSQTTTGLVDLRLERRSVANTGGTTVAVTPAQHDTNDPAPNAVLVSYSANPTTTGPAVGFPFRRALFPLTSLLTATAAPIPWVFGDAAKAIVLRGASQSLAISMSGSVSLAGGQILITVEWFES